jgi:hypothetical protein
VIDVDGTRQAARQRALPQAENLPTPHRRFETVCAPGYQGRKRGEVVRTRTVVLQAHTHQFLGTFGGPGNGDYRSELRRAIQVITNYATQLALPLASVLLRLDGLYGDAAPLLDVLTAGLGILARSRAYHLLDLSVVQQALACHPDQVRTHEDKWGDACPLRLPSRSLDACWTPGAHGGCDSPCDSFFSRSRYRA